MTGKRTTIMAGFIVYGKMFAVLLLCSLVLGLYCYAMGAERGLTLSESMADSALFFSGIFFFFLSGLLDLYVDNRRKSRLSKDGRYQLFYCGFAEMQFIKLFEWSICMFANIVRIVSVVLFFVYCPFW